MSAQAIAPGSSTYLMPDSCFCVQTIILTQIDSLRKELLIVATNALPHLSISKASAPIRLPQLSKRLSAACSHCLTCWRLRGSIKPQTTPAFHCPLAFNSQTGVIVQDVVKDVIIFADLDSEGNTTPRPNSQAPEDGVWSYLSPEKSGISGADSEVMSPLRQAL